MMTAIMKFRHGSSEQVADRVNQFNIKSVLLLWIMGVEQDDYTWHFQIYGLKK
jgi:hypothetical protein